MSKSVWLIVTMGLVTALALALGMGVSLGSFQEAPAFEWVRLAELVGREFKAEHVTLRMDLRSRPSAMKITYSSLVDSKFNLSMQNAEMEKVAAFAIQNYKGREQTMVDEIQVTRSETRGRGCFQQTYVATLTVPNSQRKPDRFGNTGAPPPQR